MTQNQVLSNLIWSKKLKPETKVFITSCSSNTFNPINSNVVVWIITQMSMKLEVVYEVWPSDLNLNISDYENCIRVNCVNAKYDG